jgi:hypothetical protein
LGFGGDLFDFSEEEDVAGDAYEEVGGCDVEGPGVGVADGYDVAGDDGGGDS